MRYTLLLHYPEMTADELGPEGLEQGQRAFTAYAATLHSAGVLLSAEVLQPSSNTTTLRADGGTVQVQDGPFADTKDQLGGTSITNVPPSWSFVSANGPSCTCTAPPSARRVVVLDDGCSTSALSSTPAECSVAA